MNNLNVSQIGGLPFTTLIIAEVQKAFAIFNAFGNIVGNYTIISGCDLVGSTVSNGFVFINGELFEFKGGLVQDRVIIIDEPTDLLFNDGNYKPVIHERFVRFGTGVGSILWSEFKRGFQTKEILEALAQKAEDSLIDPMLERLTNLEAKTAVFESGGGMVLWNKPAGMIPAGWAEVVDWRGRIPVGLKTTDVDFDEVGKTGGSKSKTLSVSEMPEHTHDLEINVNAAGAGFNSFEGESGSSEVMRSFETATTGGGEAFSIMNPYRVVIFIEYVG